MHKKHEDEHKTKEFYCTNIANWGKVCGAIFATQKQLTHHLYSCPPKNRCSKCPAAFQNASRLKEHLENLHPDDVYYCVKCEQHFPNHAEMKQHLEAMSAAEDEEHEDEEVQRIKFVKKALGEEARESMLQKVAKIKSLVGLRLDLDSPGSLSPAQINVIGENFKRFQDTLYNDPLASNNRLGPSTDDNLELFMSRPSFQTIYMYYSLDKVTGNATFITASINIHWPRDRKKKDEVTFDVSDTFMDEDDVIKLAKMLGELLQRVPVMMREMSTHLKVWLISAAGRLCRSQYPEYKAWLHVPQYAALTTSMRTGLTDIYRIVLKGYDPLFRSGWTRRFYVILQSIDPNAAVDDSELSTVQWIGNREIPAEPQDSQLTRNHFKKAFVIAQYLVAKFYGAVGKQEDVVRQAEQAYRPFRKRGYQLTRAHLQQIEDPGAEDDAGTLPTHQWNGDPVLSVSGGHVTAYSWVWPSTWLIRNMGSKRSALVVRSAQKEHIYMVVAPVLEALQNGQDAETAWGLGNYLADIFTYDNDIPVVLAACQIDDAEHADVLHFCPECVELKPHKDLATLDSFRPYPCCSNCRDGFTLGVSDFKVNIGDHGTVGYQLWRHLNTENENAGTELTPAQIKSLFKQMWADVGYLLINRDTHRDVYAKQQTNSGGPKQPTWDGCRYNPTGTSVEALYPVDLDKNGLITYHGLGNIGFTSFPWNLGKKHYPPLVFFGFALLMYADSNKQVWAYESAVAVFRTLLMNHYEYGHLGHAQQSNRLSNDRKPPSNIDDIIASFHQPVLLERTTANEDVFRFYGHAQVSTAKLRRQWRHKKHDWILFQLDAAAQEIFQDRSAVARRRWMRRDQENTEVFFPFSQTSVKREFTWWELVEVFTVKAIRNVELCQKSYTRKMKLRQMSPLELIIMIAYVWMHMVKNDLDNGSLDYDLGRDKFGFVPGCYINELLCAALANADHGRIEDLGFEYYDEDEFKKVIFNPHKCGYLWLTQFANFAEFKFSPDTIRNFILPQLPKILERVTEPICHKPLMPDHFMKIELTSDLSPFSDGTAQEKSAGKISSKTTPKAIGAEKKKQAATKKTVKPTQSKDVIPVTENFLTTTKVHENRTVSQQGQIISIEDSDFDDPDLQDIIDWGSLIPVQVAAPTDAYQDRRNLSNNGSTCYLSVNVHLLANLYGITLDFANGTTFQQDTGRLLNELSRYNDVNGQKHVVLLHKLGEVTDMVLSKGQQLDHDTTRELLAVCNELTARWDNEYEDASSFLTFMLATLNTVSDSSPVILDPDTWVERADGPMQRQAYRPVEIENFKHQAAVAKGLPLPPLQEACERHWAAYRLSGNTSPITNMSVIQLVDIYECTHPHCCINRRDISYVFQIVLQLPSTITDGEIVPLKKLVDMSLEQDFPRPSKCPNLAMHPNLPNAVPGQLHRKVTRIARAPPIFAIEINRHRNVPEAWKIDDTQPDVHFYNNRLSGYATILMQDLVNNTPALWPKPLLKDYHTHEHLEGRYLDSTYDLVGVVAYSPIIKHWTLFLRIDNTWVYFDDLQDFPMKVNPFTQWPQGFYEVGLFYRARGADLNVSPVDTVAETNLAEQARIAPVLKELQSLLEQVSAPNADQLARNIRLMAEKHEEKKTLPTTEEPIIQSAQPGTPKRHSGLRRFSQPLTSFLAGTKHELTPGNRPEEQQDPEAVATTPTRPEKKLRRRSAGDLVNQFLGRKSPMPGNETTDNRPADTTTMDSDDEPLGPPPKAQVPTLSHPMSMKTKHSTPLGQSSTTYQPLDPAAVEEESIAPSIEQGGDEEEDIVQHGKRGSRFRRVFTRVAGRRVSESGQVKKPSAKGEAKKK